MQPRRRTKTTPMFSPQEGLQGARTAARRQSAARHIQNAVQAAGNVLLCDSAAQFDAPRPPPRLPGRHADAPPPRFTAERAVSARLKLRTLPPVPPSNSRKAPLASINLIAHERPDENVGSMATPFYARVSAYAAGVLRTCNSLIAATMRLNAPILRFKRHFTPRAIFYPAKMKRVRKAI